MPSTVKVRIKAARNLSSLTPASSAAATTTASASGTTTSSTVISSHKNISPRSSSSSSAKKTTAVLHYCQTHMSLSSTTLNFIYIIYNKHIAPLHSKHHSCLGIIRACLVATVLGGASGATSTAGCKTRSTTRRETGTTLIIFRDKQHQHHRTFLGLRN